MALLHACLTLHTARAPVQILEDYIRSPNVCTLYAFESELLLTREAAVLLYAAFLANDALVEYHLPSWLKLACLFSEHLLSTTHVTGSGEE